jgi:hypothetical protein
MHADFQLLPGFSLTNRTARTLSPPILDADPPAGLGRAQHVHAAVAGVPRVVLYGAATSRRRHRS